MQIKLIIEGTHVNYEEATYDNLYDAMDDARYFIDAGYVVTCVINGSYFRILRDSGIVRSIPIDSSHLDVKNPNLSTPLNQGGSIA